jgi:hypothetical protein
MKRSPGQGRLWAATTGPARQTTASWSSRQLGRFAGAIGSPPRCRVVLAAGAPGGLDHSAGSLSSRPDRGQRSGDQGISSDVAADSDPVTAVGKAGAGLAPSHVSAADLTAVLAAARSARLRLPHRLACQARCPVADLPFSVRVYPELAGGRWGCCHRCCQSPSMASGEFPG